MLNLSVFNEVLTSRYKRYRTQAEITLHHPRTASVYTHHRVGGVLKLDALCQLSESLHDLVTSMPQAS